MTALVSWRTPVARLVVLMAVTACAACGSSTPLAPTPRIPEPAPPATPTPTSSGGWTVTIETKAVTGPAFCIYTPSVGSVFRGEYTVVRSANSVSFDPPDPVDWDSFTARIDGTDFDGTNPPFAPGGMCAHYSQSSRLTGTFAADNNSFTATEVVSYLLEDGGVRAVTFSWSGVRH